MPVTAEPIMAHVQEEFQALLTYVTGPATQPSTAYAVELTLFRRLLARGKPTPQVITAVARELLGFIWAIGVAAERAGTAAAAA